MANSVTDAIFEQIGVNKFKKYLDLSSYRQKLIAGNIANISTPGYKARDIDFQREFNRLTANQNHLAGSVTHANHIPLGDHPERPPEVLKTKLKGDEMNSVDIDQEASRMAQNELLFTVGARLLQRKFDGLKKVIRSK